MSDKEKRIWIKCPYCKTGSMYKLDVTEKDHVVYCDRDMIATGLSGVIDEGGCDCRFYVELNYQVDVETIGTRK